LGSKFYDGLGNEYTYVRAGAAIALNDAVMFEGSALGYDAVIPTAAAQQYVLGVATAAFADLEYGLVLTRGIVTCKVVVATAAGSLLATGAAAAGTLELAEATDLVGAKSAVALVTGVAAGSGIALGV
jgi:hypothetical protein